MEVIIMGKYIIEPLENEKYQEYIKRILDSRPNKKDKENYQERHHIIPKSKGGSNDEKKRFAKRVWRKI